MQNSSKAKDEVLADQKHNVQFSDSLSHPNSPCNKRQRAPRH